MKRLIKKSEIFDGTNFTVLHEERYYEIFKDPSYNEIQEIIKQDTKGSVRGIITENGEIYAWAADIWHQKMSQLINLDLIHALRIEMPKGSYLDIDGINVYFSEDICEILKKSKQKILKMFNKSEDDIVVTVQNVIMNELGDGGTLKELLEYNEDN